MVGRDRLLSLAAGTLRDTAPAEALAAAQAAGFGAVGLRFDQRHPTPAEIAELVLRLDASGLVVLDVEVVRLCATWDLDLERRLIDWAHALGARHLLVVSDDSDPARTVDGFARVAARCRDAGVSAVLEFMRFTRVCSLSEAVRVVTQAGGDTAGVLVDPLHLARAGGRPEDLAGFAAVRFPYLQFCDAPARLEDDSHEGLIHEARHARLLPGQGALPLFELLAQVDPDTPLSLEVQSDELARRYAPRARALRVMEAALAVLA